MTHPESPRPMKESIKITQRHVDMVRHGNTLYAAKTGRHDELIEEAAAFLQFHLDTSGVRPAFTATDVEALRDKPARLWREEKLRDIADRIEALLPPEKPRLDAEITERKG